MTTVARVAPELAPNKIEGAWPVVSRPGFATSVTSPLSKDRRFCDQKIRIACLLTNRSGRNKIDRSRPKRAPGARFQFVLGAGSRARVLGPSRQPTVQPRQI